MNHKVDSIYPKRTPIILYKKSNGRLIQTMILLVSLIFFSVVDYSNPLYIAIFLFVIILIYGFHQSQQLQINDKQIEYGIKRSYKKGIELSHTINLKDYETTAIRQREDRYFEILIKGSKNQTIIFNLIPNRLPAQEAAKSMNSKIETLISAVPD